MTLNISTALRDWKNADDRGSPIVVLYEIDIDDSTILRLVAGDPTGTGSIVYDGETYFAAAIERGDTEQNIAGDFRATTIGVSNIDGVAGGYIEQYDLDGQEVRIITVLKETLLPADSVTETFTIGPMAYDRRVATFTMGPPNFFKRRSSRRRFLRHRCGHDWENRFISGNECYYPSDFFEADTIQDILVGATTDGEQARKFGWYAINATKTDAFNVGGDIDSALVIEADGDDLDWSATSRAAPFLYKKLEGDFDVWTKVSPLTTRIGCLAGILCQEIGDDLDSWAFVGRAQDVSGDLFVRAASAVDGVAESELAAAENGVQYVRMARSANTFAFYYSDDAETWTSLGSKSLALETDVRIGLCLSAPGIESGPISASFDRFVFLAGGVSDCERTLDFCSGLGHAHRYYGFPGIPRA